MNTTKHTPGPWQVSPHSNITSKSLVVAKVEQMPGNYESEKQANARLIAAAPDLLFALEACMENMEGMLGISDFGSPTEGDFPLAIVRAAIAKAKGGAA
jgi:hypothetical protein